MSLEKHSNLSEAVVIQTTTKASGGQREVKGPLHSPYQKTMTFTKPLLQWANSVPTTSAYTLAHVYEEA
ncbi:hypothetical protein Pcac1_g22017 [Phytophthora cactorum]|nr:hypothetical protein Pcac1_g22017 [Phytophthora cactorum]KAG3155878.1 hypothetical protein C6341_g15247 [Phytophthora cactorum]KAG4051497.1 hypothetical protein PC123_g13287 [Phytophthora cactorum]